MTFTGNSTLQYGLTTTTDISSRLVINNGITGTIDTVANNVTFATGFGASGTGSLTKVGTGTLTLSGANTYTGVTTISAGTLQFANTSSLYNSTTTSWTAANIRVASGGTVALNVGGAGQFTTGNVTTLLTNLGGLGGAPGSGNGLQSGSKIAFDTTNAAGGTFTVADNIANSTGTGGGAIGVNKIGTNVLVLSGTNTFSGGVTGSSGTLRVNTGSVGSGGLTFGGITFASTGSTAISVSPNIFLNTVSATTTFGDVVGTGAITLAGGLQLSSSGTARTVNTVVDVNVTGTLSGTNSSSMTKSGAATLTLSNAGGTIGGLNNIIVTNGTLAVTRLANSTTNSSIGQTTAVATVASITLDGGTLSYISGGAAASSTDRLLQIGQTTAGGTGTISSNATVATETVSFTNTNAILFGTTAQTRNLVLTGTNTGNNTLGSPLNNNGTGVTTLTKQGAGTWVLSAANAFTGVTTISAGTLRLGAAGDATNTPLGTTTAGTTVSGTGTLDLVGFTLGTAEALSLAGTGTSNSGALANSATTAASYSGLVTLGGSASIVAGGGTGANIILSNTGTITGATFGLTLDGTATGSSITSIIGTTSGTLTKQGSGTWALSGANTYSGGSSINGGILQASSNSAFGSGTVAINGGVRILVDTGLTITNAITLGTNAGAAGRGLIEAGTVAGTSTVSGPITINNGALGGGHFAAPSASTILHLSGVITSTIPTISQRVGTVMFSGGGTGYTGLTQTGTTIVGANNGIATSATVTLGGSADGTVDLNGLNQSLVGIIKTPGNSAIIGNSSTTVGSTLTITGTSTYDGTIVDVISPGTQKVSLIVNSSGSLTLTGANTYTGQTSVIAGNLRGTSTGSINNSTVVVSSTGAMWPGTALTGSAVPTLGESFSVGGLNFGASAGGKLKIALNTSDPATSTQTLFVTGSAPNSCNLANGTLSLGIATSATTGTYTILSCPNSTIVNAFTDVTINNSPLISLSGLSPYTVATQNGVIILTINSNIVTVQVFGGVTPVKVADFAAKSEGAGVNVSWTCVSEYQNAGFNIYRRAVESSEWFKVNPTLIAGRITNPDEKKYTYLDWAEVGMYEYQLESIDVFGAREIYGKLTGVVSLDGVQVADVSDVGIDAAISSIDMEVGVLTARRVEAQFAAVRTANVTPAQSGVPTLQTVTAHDIPAGTRSASVAAKLDISHPTIGARWFSSGSVTKGTSYSAAKVVYKNAGVMLIPQASMPAGYDLNQVSIQREGRSMNALANVAGGLLVYASGYSDNYTDKDALFLRKTNTPTTAGTPTKASGLFSSSLPVNATSSNTIKTEYHDVYFDYSLRPYSFEPWFSSKYLTQGSTQNFTIKLPDVCSGSANLVVNIWSLTSSERISPDHGMQVLVNAQAIGETTWDGGNKMVQMSFTIPSGALTSGDNVVSLVTPTIAGLDTQIAFLHSINVSYTRGLDGSKPVEINNAGNTASLYEVSNIPASGAWVVDARFDDRAALVPTESQMQSGGTLKVRFMAQSGGSGRYLVVPVGQENSPVSISARQVKPLALNGTYLATGPAQFASGIQPLLIKRSREGIRGAFVDQEQLFDYYNYGRFGPYGIRNAVRSARPTYLLLVGRTTYDYRNYEGQNIDPLCPAFLVPTNFWAQTTSDSAFGDLGRGFPEVAIGRLPVNNTTELSGSVSHIVSYKGIPASGVRLHAVADRTDPVVADFGAQLDNIIKANHPDITWQENYLARTRATAPEVTAAMKDAANGGADIILYSGHGNAARLGAADPRILDQASVQMWTGNTVFIQLTCTANWMAKNVPGYQSIAIRALTQPQGGISASIGTSTYMNSDVATAFMNQLLKNTSDSNVRWGSVLMKTQQWAGSQSGSAFYKDLMTTEQLFGDPAMPVFTPKPLAPSTSSSSNAAGTF